MADADQSLNIDINLRTKKSGADAAKEIKKVADESERYQQVLEKMRVEQVLAEQAIQKTTKAEQSQSAGAADLSQTTAELEGNLTKSKAATDRLTISTQGLGQAMRFLPGPLKEVVAGFRLLFTNPIVALFVAGAAAVKLFADQLKKLHENERTVELLKNMSTSVREAREAVANALDPWKAHTAAMQDNAAAASAVDQQTKDAVDNIREVAKWKEEEAKAEDALAAAKLKARHTAGELTDEQYARESALMAERVQGRQTQRSADTAQQIIAAKQQGLAAAEGRTGALAGAVSSTAQRRAGIEGGLAAARADVAAYEAKQKTQGLTPEETAVLYQRRAFITNAEIDLPQAQAAEAQAGRAASANTASVVALRREIPQLQTSAAREASARGNIHNLNVQARMAGETGNARTVLDAAAGADALQAGGQATAAQMAALRKAAETFGLVGQSNETILAVLARMNDDQVKFQRSLDAFNRRLNTGTNEP